MASAEECFREAERLEQEGGRDDEAREMYKRAAKMRAAAEEANRTETEDSLVELPPGLDISRIRLSDSAPDTSRDCSQPPGLGHAGGGNCASESEQCVSDETERELGEPEQAQSASNVDIACSEIEYSDEKEDGPPIATAVPVAKVEEEDEDEEEEEDWETALETEIDKKIPQVSSKARSNRPMSNSSSVKGRGNFRYGSSSHMDEDAYSELNVEGGEVDDLREHDGRYFNCNRDPDPNRAGPDEELHKSQAPSRPRPKTTAVVANRLIANALNHGGLRQHIKRTDREAGRALERSRQAKREERSRAQALRDSAWDD